MIKRLKIFPAIGIARLGNSKDEYFIGPEKPGDTTLPPGGFRDAAGAIKRQAARFHLFAFDEADALIGEITADDVRNIEWTVHTANTKAAAEAFHGKGSPTSGLRNRHFAGDRNQLKLDPGAAAVSGRNPDFANLNKSRTTGAARELTIDQLFLNQPAKLSLGTITTDDHGLLLFLGGYGESKSPIGADLSDIPPNDFANHDGWYDDVSDGRISAVVTLQDGSTPPVADAWVLVAPPKYAPGLKTVVTLYDTMLQKAIDSGQQPNPFDKAEFQPSLAEDILPILTRAADMRWVYHNGQPQISPATFHHVFSTMPPANRQGVFDRLSIPPATPGDPSAGGGRMPRAWSDLYPGGLNGTLTKTQYETLRKWKDGQFVPGAAPSATDAISPDGLTRAALDTCVGAPFFPGIEASWKIRDVFPSIEPFRLDSTKVNPGDVSSQMSLPWQSDFLDCYFEPSQTEGNLVWWPAQRPIAVLKPGSNTYIPWNRVSDADLTPLNVEQMVTEWFRLAFVMQGPSGRHEEEPRA